MYAAPTDLYGVLAQRDGWEQARARLAHLYAEHGEAATQKAEAYARRYEGQRGAMVVDVVASAQRRYKRVLKHIAPAYIATAGSADLITLAESPPAYLPLRKGEAQTMSDVAAGLLRWRKDQECETDEEAVFSWAHGVETVRVAPRLDPYVGEAKGIGVALFAYLRMRSGADALKPDLRVWRALTDLGLSIPRDPVAWLLVCEVLAENLAIPRLVLDQLLW